VRKPDEAVLTKDEICGAFDVGFCEELGAGLSEDCVLETEEFAGVVALVLFCLLVRRKGGR
jgi:hypothetical protein